MECGHRFCKECVDQWLKKRYNIIVDISFKGEFFYPIMIKANALFINMARVLFMIKANILRLTYYL